MNKTIKILAITLTAILAVGAVAIIGTGLVLAQTPTETPEFGPGWMMGSNFRDGNSYRMMGGRGWMGGFAQDGERWEWMNAMHDWMGSGMDMHTSVWGSLAEIFGLTSSELDAEVNSGKTLAEIAAEKGISRSDMITLLETAHQETLDQAVADGVLTQEQADSMLSSISSRYEWMLDNMDSARLDAGPRGRMGGFAGRSGDCHAGWNSSPDSSQPRP